MPLSSSHCDFVVQYCCCFSRRHFNEAETYLRTEVAFSALASVSLQSSGSMSSQVSHVSEQSESDGAPLSTQIFKSLTYVLELEQLLALVTPAL